MAGILAGAKWPWAEGLTVDATGAGTPAKRETLIVEGAALAFSPTLLNWAKSGMEVMATPMHPIFRLYEVKLRDLVEQNEDV